MRSDSFNEFLKKRDNVEWDEELLEEARQKINKNSTVHVDSARANELEQNAGDYWNKFYGIHENKFFKDRNWLFTEFPELLVQPESESMASDQKFFILEVGCGVGNTILPIIRSNK